jgi:hypothetical protein
MILMLSSLMTFGLSGIVQAAGTCQQPSTKAFNSVDHIHC